MDSESAVSRLILLQALAGLGNIVELDFLIPQAQFIIDTAPFAQSWCQYNPRKQVTRQGLSLTSLDGELSGTPDLDSLAEYNLINKTSHDEHHFIKTTPVFHAMEALRPLLAYFSPYLGRSHLIRFQAGGHFPPHRDAFGIGMRCFRILGLCQNCEADQMVFLMDNERVPLQAGRVYFVETRHAHSLFSFADNCTIVVLNVILNEHSFRAVMKAVKIR